MNITEQPTKKTSELLDECRALFPVWSYYDDARLDADFPAPKEAATRSFKDTVEADENWANVSAEDLQEQKVQGITLRERIIMELEHFKETGKHLDIENWTLCAGSRRAGGRVPCTSWGGGKFRVRWAHPARRYPWLRVREAFPLTLDPSPSSPSDLESRITHIEAVLKHHNLNV